MCADEPARPTAEALNGPAWDKAVTYFIADALDAGADCRSKVGAIRKLEENP